MLGTYGTDCKIELTYATYFSALTCHLPLVSNPKHSGIMKSDVLGNLVKESESNSGAVDWTIVAVLILKIGVLAFTVTLQYWTTNADILTLCGCAIVFAMACTR